MATAVDSVPGHHSRTKESENYDLRFDDDAKLRLAQQNAVTRELMGGSFLPSEEIIRLRAIAETGKHPRIADIGTGPGDWMFDVRAQLREAGIDAVLHGYDLFPVHFPPEEKQVAEDLSFYQLNIHQKETFPKLDEGYDLVHLRYLSIVITEKQWESAFNNCTSMLKPGGTMMWEEILFDQFIISDRAKYPHANKIFDIGVSMFKQLGMLLNCGPKLNPLFQNNFNNVLKDEFTTKALEERWQRLQAQNMYMVTREMVVKWLERGDAALKQLGLSSVEEGNELAQLSMQDYQNGCLTNMSICRWIGEDFVV
ncbi:hypothetical protein H072_4040 [Dactylellina haptotyla CBS 200.50]|uniref:Methyltransferase domain-containing protein n=1 Tax=Dactylellina haptotyla (strain CBS 200.50) TaxID=1284197 RepID=S8AGN6_DACHA|nr:hypothetical protein H072_4040 [Dactylellina haptotyla CBS 200.50]